jgi:hypothetical protein
MAEPCFILYLVVERSLQAYFEHDGCISRSIISPDLPYIDLRECYIDAFNQAKESYGDRKMSRDSHMLVRVYFSPGAILHYISEASGPEHDYASVLHKKIYYGDQDYDRKEWHFLGDLPLRSHDPFWTSKVTTEWCELPLCCPL